MTTTQVAIRRSSRCRVDETREDSATEHDPRPSAAAREWTWRTGTDLRDSTAFWSHR